MSARPHRFELSRQLYELNGDVAPVIEKLNSHTILVDRLLLSTMTNRIRDALDHEVDQFTALVDGPINPESPAEIRQLLFEKYKLAPISRTQGGVESVSSKVLTRLLKDNDHEILRRLLLIRELSSSKKHLKIVDKKSKGLGRVYPELHGECSTGRLYSWAIALGEDARQTLVPVPGNVFLSADFKSQELAIVALLAGEDGLVQALQNGEDNHANTARAIFHADDITPEQRAIGKTTNYAVLFLTSPRGLAWQLGISEPEAKTILDRWNATYPRIASWIDQQLEHIRTKGFVDTAFGMRAYRDGAATTEYAKAREERRLVNCLVQSVGAVFLKRAMIRAAQAGLKIVLPRHDALIVECHQDEAETTSNKLRDAMAISWRGFTFDVELKVGINLNLDPISKGAVVCSGA